MSITRWDPFTAVSALARWDAEFDSIIERTWRAPARVPAFSPAINVTRDGSDVLIRFEVPGLDPEKDLNVELEGSSLIVSGERRTEASPTAVREWRYGAFRRSFRVPDSVTADQVFASYEHGILTVRLSGAIPPEPVATKIAIAHDAKQAITAASDTE